MPIKKNRPRKTGVRGIRQDGPDRFLVRVDWTDPKTGRRRKSEGVARTLAEGVELREQLKRKDDRAPRSRTRFADFAKQWIVGQAERLAPSTRERYVNALAHLTEGLGEYYVDAIGPAEIRRWRDEVAKRLTAPTVNGHVRVLRQALEQLVEDGAIKMNPARKVRALPEKRTQGPRGTALTAEQLNKYLVAVERLRDRGELSEDVARLMLMLAWTGLRRGEALALKWSDLDRGEIKVERAVWRGIEGTTKTDDPRIVTVVEPLAKILAEQRRWLIAVQHPGLASDLMFPADPSHARSGASRRKQNPDEVTWYRSGSVLNGPIAKAVAEAKIPRISPHSFRRTWENMLPRAGVDQLVRRSLAGWRSEEAQAIYASVDSSEREAAGRAVVSLVLGSKATPSATPEPENENARNGALSPTGRQDSDFVRAGDGICC
jgi:integrase